MGTFEQTTKLLVVFVHSSYSERVIMQSKIKKSLKNIPASTWLHVRTFLNHLAGFTSHWHYCLSGLHTKQQVFCHELEYKSHFHYPVLVILMLFQEFLKTFHPDEEVSYSVFISGVGVDGLFLNKYISSLCGKELKNMSKSAPSQPQI